MGTVGVQEMVVIFLVALILFGPKELPELGKRIGKAITEFRRASSDLKATFEREMHNLERETEALKEPPPTAAIAPASQSEPYSYDYNGEYIPDYEQSATATSTVSASEIPGAESKGTGEAAPPEQAAVEVRPAVEGTVPRSEAPRA
ncbi:MAG TPA: twin-arginine translocase TatA/TatE family subunit [Bryobacteraceae bacterium]|nr:twin-arginine translocase TatA/TatE family subunit [Bryobacteraceae bacterium]